MVALHSESCFCFRGVVAIVSEFRQVCPQRVLSLSGFSHGGGAVGVTLHVRFERGWRHCVSCGGNIGGRANAGQRFISVECSFSGHLNVHLVHCPFTLMYLF